MELCPVIKDLMHEQEIVTKGANNMPTHDTETIQEILNRMCALQNSIDGQGGGGGKSPRNKDENWPFTSGSRRPSHPSEFARQNIYSPKEAGGSPHHGSQMPLHGSIMAELRDLRA